MSFLLFWGPEQVNRGSTRVCRHVVHVEMLFEGLTTGMYPPHCLFQTLPTANSRSHDNNQNWCKQIIVKFPSWSLCVLTSHISTSLQSSLQSTRSALTMTSKMTPRCRNARQRQSVNVITVFGFIFSLFKVPILLLSKVITDSEELFSRLKDQNSQGSLTPPYYNVPSVNFKKVRCTRTCIYIQENNIVYMYIYFELES